MPKRQPRIDRPVRVHAVIRTHIVADFRISELLEHFPTMPIEPSLIPRFMDQQQELQTEAWATFARAYNKRAVDADKVADLEMENASSVRFHYRARQTEKEKDDRRIEKAAWSAEEGRTADEGAPDRLFHEVVDLDEEMKQDERKTK